MCVRFLVLRFIYAVPVILKRPVYLSRMQRALVLNLCAFGYADLEAYENSIGIRKVIDRQQA